MMKYYRILLRKRKVSELVCRQLKKYSAAIYGKHDNITQSRRFACCIDKARDIHSEYVKNVAFFTPEIFTQPCHNVTVIRKLSILCLCFQNVLLICINHQIYTQGLQTNIVVTKYVSTKPFQNHK
jgi:hypothetical protein